MRLCCVGGMPVPNRACAALFGSNVAGANMLRRLLANPAAVQAIVNWPEVAWAEPARLRRHLDRAPLDAERTLVALAETAAADLHRPAEPSGGWWSARGFGSARRWFAPWGWPPARPGRQGHPRRAARLAVLPVGRPPRNASSAHARLTDVAARMLCTEKILDG
jgi:hypothetical protein